MYISFTIFQDLNTEKKNQYFGGKFQCIEQFVKCFEFIRRFARKNLPSSCSNFIPWECVFWEYRRRLRWSFRRHISSFHWICSKIAGNRLQTATKCRFDTQIYNAIKSRRFRWGYFVCIKYIFITRCIEGIHFAYHAFENLLCSIKFDKIVAARARDSIMKLIYEQLFQYLIDKSNGTLINSSSAGNALLSSAHINILDIPGFGTQHFLNTTIWNCNFKNNFSRNWFSRVFWNRQKLIRTNVHQFSQWEDAAIWHKSINQTWIRLVSNGRFGFSPNWFFG